MNELSLPSARILWRQRDWSFRLCYWLVFLKVVDIRNGEQLKDSFTLIFRILEERPEQCGWLVFTWREDFIQRAIVRKIMQPWERAGDCGQVGKESHTDLGPPATRKSKRAYAWTATKWNWWILARIGPGIEKAKQEQFLVQVKLVVMTLAVTSSGL